MDVASGTSVAFPFDGKFRALALKIAVSSDAAPHAQATVRIMADGVEVGQTQPFKAGDEPRFVEIDLQNPKELTLQADSDTPGTKVLYIDPVGIRN